MMTFLRPIAQSQSLRNQGFGSELTDKPNMGVGNVKVAIPS